MNKKVMIGCPVRNRAWILQRYLQYLENLDYPKSLREYCFIVNDCTDATPDILRHFAQTGSAPVTLIEDNNNKYPGYLRGQYSFPRLAYLRNLLLHAFLQSDCGYLFSVDSDILVPSDALNRLISSDKGVISCLVSNGHEVGNSLLFNILNKVPDRGYIHITEIPRDRIFEVDCTGAAYLISRKVAENCGVRYSAVYGPEDIGFCENAKSKGIKIYCDGRIQCRHIMRPPPGAEEV